MSNEYTIQFRSDRDGRWLDYLATPPLLSGQDAAEYIDRHMEGQVVRIVSPDGEASAAIDTAATGEDYRNYIA